VAPMLSIPSSARRGRATSGTPSTARCCTRTPASPTRFYTAEIAGNGTPYAPHPEDGYACDTSQVRETYNRVALPAQTATIVIVVKDEWGRRTSAAFPIPVRANPYSAGESASDPDETVFYVADSHGDPYHRRACDCAMR
jgi:hypothetical protein